MFSDRDDAGRQLAARLSHLRTADPVVLALPRGGVPVGLAIARSLGCPLDIVLVRKIGAPSQPELAAGAVVDGATPETVVNHDVVRALGIGADYIAAEGRRQLAEIERRRLAYVGDRPRPPLDGRTAIVVDDGIATGATMRAALIAVRRAEPRRLVLAIPVAAPDTLAELASEVDEIVCLDSPEWFQAIGMFYGDFHQIEDREVVDLLARAPLAAPEESHSAADDVSTEGRGPSRGCHLHMAILEKAVRIG